MNGHVFKWALVQLNQSCIHCRRILQPIIIALHTQCLQRLCVCVCVCVCMYTWLSGVVLQWVSGLLTPADRVQVWTVRVHPVVVLSTPAIKMDLGRNKGRGQRKGGGAGTLRPTCNQTALAALSLKTTLPSQQGFKAP